MIDLHLHSNRSDGSETPTRVVELAAEAGLSGLALTDHDTVAGLDEAASAAARLGLRFVPGIELSCHTPERTVHMLAYLIDPLDVALDTALMNQRILRAERNAALIDILQNLNYDITLDEVLKVANGATVGRPHFARALVDKGYFSSIDQAFIDLLADGGNGFVERREFPAEKAIEMIHNAGGLAVWAHPMRNRDVSDMQPTLAFMVEHGLDGVETYYSRFSTEQVQYVKSSTKAAGLICTGGSDFHGTYKPDLVVGRGEGNLKVPDQVIDELEARKQILFG